DVEFAGVAFVTDGIAIAEVDAWAGAIAAKLEGDLDQPVGIDAERLLRAHFGRETLRPIAVATGGIDYSRHEPLLNISRSRCVDAPSDAWPKGLTGPEPFVDLHHRRPNGMPREADRGLPRADLQAGVEVPVEQDAIDAGRHGLRIAGRHQAAAHVLLDREAHSADARGDDRRAAGHRFDGDQPERFVARRDGADASSGVDLG